SEGKAGRAKRGTVMPVRLVRILGTALLLGLVPLGTALARNPNEKEIKPRPNVQDKDEIYDKEGTPRSAASSGCSTSRSSLCARSRETSPAAVSRSATTSGIR